MTLLLLLACGPAIVAFPGVDPGVRDTGAVDTDTGSTAPTDDTAAPPDDTSSPCVGEWHPDADGDGFGDAATTSTDCDAPAGWLADDGDCDDTDAAVNPGAAEACDGLDEDCDGVPDDGLGDACGAELDARTVSDAGWTVVGVNTNDGVGSGGVVTAADLDRDGWPELVVAAPLHGAADAGAIAVHGADTAALGVSFDSGVLVQGDAARDRFGASAALLGDLDGDGWDELLAGAPLANGEETDGGAAWIFDLSEGADTVSGIASGAVWGEGAGGLLGSAVAAGDIDGDGLFELVLGAPGESSGRGQVYVGDGDGQWWEGTTDAGELDASFAGIDSGDALGTAVAATADLDGDGYGEVLACAPGAGADAGACWLVTGGWGEEAEGDDIGALAVASFAGAAAGDALGYGPTAVAAADLDGDGAADLVLGAPGWDGAAADGGAVAIWWGGRLSGAHDLEDADLVVSGDGALGRALSVGADLDGDGAMDLLAGAPTAGAGTLYLLVGLGAGGVVHAPDGAHTSWAGATAGDAFASTVGALVDVDGDGAIDLAAAAPGAADRASNGGTVYVLTP